MNAEWSIQRVSATSRDVATLAGWNYQQWGHLHPGRSLSDAVTSFREECGEVGVPSVLAAMSGDSPVGMASLIADDMSDRRDLTPWLASVYVLPAWRGQGIASQLVQAIEQEARGQGIERFYLYTPDQQALYRRLGWHDVETRDYRGERVTIMQRQLSEPR